jgi:hypothetical protein
VIGRLQGHTDIPLDDRGFLLPFDHVREHRRM